MQAEIFKKNYRGDIVLLLKLAIPMVLTGLVQASTGFFSTLFLARLGHQALAAGAVVVWMFATLMVVLWGTLTSVSVLVAQNYGAKNHAGIVHVLRDALLIALLFVIPSSFLLWNMAPILLLLGQTPATVLLAQGYLHGLVWGLLPDFVTLVLMQFLIGLGHARTDMVFSMIGVPLVIGCNYALMFGKWGFPTLGIAGIGYGTSLSYWIWGTLMLLYLLLNRNYRHYFAGMLQFKRPYFFGELCKIGLPMGSMYCIEIAFFFTVTLMMGHFGSQYQAANQIALQFLGQLSVVTFAIAQAVTVRVGHSLGAQDTGSAERAGYCGMFIAALFMIMVACSYWFFPLRLIALDFNVHLQKNQAIVQYAQQFLAISALFQLFEAVRLTLFGALRGFKDTRFTLITSIISFWCVSLPIGYLLATRLHWNGTGIWWGMVVGAACGMALLLSRFRFKLKVYQP